MILNIWHNVFVLSAEKSLCDMSAFVSVMVGILFCTSFWDKPRRAALIFIKAWSKRRVDQFRREVSADPDVAKACNALNWEKLDGFADKQVKLVQKAVRGWINVVYTILAIFIGLCGLFELLFSRTKDVGEWNVVAFSPFLVYLLLCLGQYIMLRIRIWFELSFFKLVIKFKMYNYHDPENNRQAADRMVPDPNNT